VAPRQGECDRDPGESHSDVDVRRRHDPQGDLRLGADRERQAQAIREPARTASDAAAARWRVAAFGGAEALEAAKGDAPGV
jgi:hypothetical protein